MSGLQALATRGRSAVARESGTRILAGVEGAREDFAAVETALDCLAELSGFRDKEASASSNAAGFLSARREGIGAAGGCALLADCMQLSLDASLLSASSAMQCFEGVDQVCRRQSWMHLERAF